MYTKIQVIKYSKVWLTISGVLVAASILATIAFGLNFGIDFTGGSLIHVATTERADVADVRAALSDLGFEAVVQGAQENNELFIRTRDVSVEEHDQIITALSERWGDVEEHEFESIGPSIGNELKRKSLIALVVLCAMIVLYVAWAFRKVFGSVASWKYGVITMIAAVHDVIIPIGVLAVLGKFAGYQVDGTVVAGLLTILGYSINDTIVIFDRIRENLSNSRHDDVDFDTLVNKSIQQSFARSFNTQFSTLLVLFAIFFFGGETTRPFTLTFIIGLIAGTYSSIFLASPLLVFWEKWKK